VLFIFNVMSHDLRLMEEYRVWIEENGSTENSVTEDDDEKDPELPIAQCFVIAGFFVIWHRDSTLEILFGPLLLWSGKAVDYCV